MTSLNRVVHKNGNLVFFCPGCKDTHTISTKTNMWSYNNNPINPTFHPSVLITSGHYLPNHTGECWCTYNAKHEIKSSFTCKRCHSFITEGSIKFLSDCSHSLASQTVEIPPWPYDQGTYDGIIDCGRWGGGLQPHSPH